MSALHQFESTALGQLSHVYCVYNLTTLEAYSTLNKKRVNANDLCRFAALAGKSRA